MKKLKHFKEVIQDIEIYLIQTYDGLYNKQSKEWIKGYEKGVSDLKRRIIRWAELTNEL